MGIMMGRCELAGYDDHLWLTASAGPTRRCGTPGDRRCPRRTLRAAYVRLVPRDCAGSGAPVPRSTSMVSVDVGQHPTPLRCLTTHAFHGITSTSMPVTKGNKTITLSLASVSRAPFASLSLRLALPSMLLVAHRLHTRRCRRLHRARPPRSSALLVPW